MDFLVAMQTVAGADLSTLLPVEPFYYSGKWEGYGGCDEGIGESG